MRLISALISVLILASPAVAQIPFAFKFKEGEPLLFRTTHDTTVQVKTKDDSSSTHSIVKQLKRWDVTKVDSLQVATLELSIRELMLEQTDPSGESMRFDSTDPTSSDPQLAEQLRSVVGRPILQVELDPTGAIKAYKHLTQRQDVLRDLPFVITVPSDKLPTVGTAWRRDFPITLEPPVVPQPKTLRGIQNCTVKESNSDRLVVAVQSQLAEKIAEPGQMIPVLQFLPTGTVVFDPKKGRMLQATMTIDEKVANFNGEGSEYHFLSKYTEELVPDVQQADRRP